MLHHAGSDTFFMPEGGFGGDGVHVFDAASGARLTEPIRPTGGAPTDIEFVEFVQGIPGGPACAARSEDGKCAAVPGLSAPGRLLLAAGLLLLAAPGLRRIAGVNRA